MIELMFLKETASSSCYSLVIFVFVKNLKYIYIYIYIYMYIYIYTYYIHITYMKQDGRNKYVIMKII